MFEKTYIFQGKHAKFVENLAGDDVLFNRYLDILILAPVLGYLNGKEAELDKGDKSAKVFAEQIIKESEKLKFIFQLITIQDKTKFPDDEKRFNIAFRYKDGSDYDQAISNFNNYIRGGVEYLHSMIFEDEDHIQTYKQDQLIDNFFSYIEHFREDINNNKDFDLEDIVNNYKD